MELEGQRIDKLVVLSRAENRMVGKRNRPFWNVKCDCGTVYATEQSPLARKKRLSLPCMCRFCSAKKAAKKAAEAIETHGLSSHPLYRKYYDIKARLRRDSNYKHISMCEAWNNDFMSFYKWSLDNGWKNGLEIDRFPNRNGDYEPSNCRYVDDYIQAQNKNLYKQSKHPNIHKIGKTFKVRVQRNNQRISKVFKTLKEAEMHRDNILGVNNV